MPLSKYSKNKKDASEEKGLSKRASLSPKDYEAFTAYRKKLKHKKTPLKTQVKRAMKRDYTVPDPQMRMHREEGRYLAGADTDPEQFVHLISEGPFSHFDDHFVALMAGAVDEYTWRSADNLADLFFVITNIATIAAEGKLPKKEEYVLGNKIRELRDKVLPQYGLAEAGRWVANLLPFFVKGKLGDPVAEGLFGTVGLITAKYGPKKAMDIIKKSGELAEKFPEKEGLELFAEAANSIGLSPKDAKWAMKFHKAAQLANTPAGRGMAQQYGYETAAQDTFTPSPGSIIFAGGLGAGISGAGKLIKVLKGRKEPHIKAIKDSAEAAELELNLNKDSSELITKFQDLAATGNKEQLIEAFKEEVQKLYKRTRVAAEVADQTLVRNIKDIPVQHIEDIVNGLRLKLLKHSLSDDDLAIYTVMLETGSDAEKIREMFKKNKVVTTIEDVADEVGKETKKDMGAYQTFKDRIKSWNKKEKQIGDYERSVLDKKQNVISIGGIKGRLVKKPIKKIFLKGGDTIDEEMRRVQAIVDSKYQGGSTGAGVALAAALNKMDEIIESLKIHKDQYEEAFSYVKPLKTKRKEGAPYKAPKIKKLEKDADVLAFTKSWVGQQTQLRSSPKGKPPLQEPAMSETELRATKNIAKEAAKWNEATEKSLGGGENANFMRIFREVEMELGEVLKRGIKNDAGEFIKAPASQEYRAAMDEQSKVNRVLFGDSRFKESGILNDAGLKPFGYDGKGYPVLGYDDVEKSYKYILDVLFRDLTTPRVKRDIRGKAINVKGRKVYRVSEQTDDPSKGYPDSESILKGKDAEYRQDSEGKDPKTRSFLGFLNILQDEGVGTTEAFINTTRKQFLNNALKNEDTANELVSLMQGSRATFGKAKPSAELADIRYDLEMGKAIITHPLLSAIVGMGTYNYNVTSPGWWQTVAVGYATWQLNKIVKARMAAKKRHLLDPKVNLEKITKLNKTLEDFDKAWETGDWSLVKPELFQMGLVGKGGFKWKQLTEKFSKWRQEENLGKMDTFLQGGLEKGERYMSNTSRPTRGGQIMGEEVKRTDTFQPTPTTPPEGADPGIEGPIDWSTQEPDFGGAKWERGPQSLEINQLQEPTPMPRLDEDYIQEDPGLQGPPGARGEFMTPERNVITTEIEEEEEIMDPEVDERERRKERVISFLKKQGAYKRNKRVV